MKDFFGMMNNMMNYTNYRMPVNRPVKPVKRAAEHGSIKEQRPQSQPYYPKSQGYQEKTIPQEGASRQINPASPLKPSIAGKTSPVKSSVKSQVKSQVKNPIEQITRLNRESIVAGIIFSEILGKPRAFRKT